MLLVPGPAARASNATSMTSPALIVLLVIMIGAVIFLRSTRYIRRSSAFVMIGVLILALMLLIAWNWMHP